MGNACINTLNIDNFQKILEEIDTQPGIKTEVSTLGYRCRISIPGNRFQGINFRISVVKSMAEKNHWGVRKFQERSVESRVHINNNISRKMYSIWI